MIKVNIPGATIVAVEFYSEEWDECVAVRRHDDGDGWVIDPGGEVNLSDAEFSDFIDLLRALRDMSKP